MVDKIIDICYFCGEEKELKGTVKCTDEHCDENHAICNECLQPAIEKFFAEMEVK